MATFVGSSQSGILGALVATLGIVLPSFIIILLIASIIKGLLKFAGVKAFLSGLRPIVVGLIVGTAITMFLSVVLSLETVYGAVSFDWKALVIFAIIAIAHLIYKKFTPRTALLIIL